MSKKFQRTREDFTCQYCGAEVAGSGYTNHCPRCLWSKHVDINPGDRAADCGGMMEPVGLERRGEGYAIQHRCTRCGFERRNRATGEDDFTAILALARRIAAPR